MSRREASPGTEPVLRPMREEDLPVAMQIDAANLARPWSETIWREELRSPFGRYLVLEQNDEIVAQIGVKRTVDELHIMTIVVRPEYRRRGYARRLIEAAVARYPKARRVHLEVRPSNRAARTLYEALGFVVNGRRRGYYGDEDALLMTLDL